MNRRRLAALILAVVVLLGAGAWANWDRLFPHERPLVSSAVGECPPPEPFDEAVFSEEKEEETLSVSATTTPSVHHTATWSVPTCGKGELAVMPGVWEVTIAASMEVQCWSELNAWVVGTDNCQARAVLEGNSVACIDHCEPTTVMPDDWQTVHPQPIFRVSCVAAPKCHYGLAAQVRLQGSVRQVFVDDLSLHATVKIPKTV